MSKSVRFLKFLVCTLILLYSGFNNCRAQIQNSIAIVLNEYCVGNMSISDNYGQTSDWVEIRNNHTASVSLSGYYLSNDKLNLTKWKFPASFTLGINQVGIVYLSGRNEAKYQNGQWYHHANFNIDQCKKQWLILCTPQVALRDSVAIQITKAGHTRGRIDANILGISGWRVYTNHSFLLPNPPVNYFKGYLPTPIIKPAAGWNHNGETVDMFLPGQTTPYSGADTNNCFQIHYTTNGCEPTKNDPVYTYTDPTCPQGGISPIIILDNMVIRAATFPRGPISTVEPCAPCLANNNACAAEDQVDWLPSFIQTNTYLSGGTGSMDNLDGNFGLMAVTGCQPDSSWLMGSGNGEPAVHVEYFDCANKSNPEILEGYASLYKPPQESWLTQQRGFYITMDDRRGFGCNFEHTFFDNSVLGTSSRKIFPTLHVYGGDHESLSPKNGSPANTSAAGTGLRDVFHQSLALKYNLDVNPLHMKPIILVINGRYQGAYTLKEVYDKFYEAFYKGQSRDSCFLQTYDFGDNFVYHPIDSKISSPQQIGISDGIFRTEVFDYCNLNTMASSAFYNTLMSRLDKRSFIDYMITQNFMLNSDMFNTNVAFGKGHNKTAPGGDRWHYFLWNTPAILTYSATQTNTLALTNPSHSPCSYSTFPQPSLYGGNTHGGILRKLMSNPTGNLSFQQDYKNRYQDLLNTAFKCENILSHYDAVVNLYSKEMKYMEDNTSNPASPHSSVKDDFDSNTVRLRRVIAKRCNFMSTEFTNQISGCYGMFGPYDVVVDVYPEGAGNVKLNSLWLTSFTWRGKYMKPAQLSFKAVPTSTNYVFHHWEFKAHYPMNGAPLSYDSISIELGQADEIKAVFTDVTTDIDLPTGFSPNGDGVNDFFKPAGSALFSSEYEMKVWNRWGQEVFRSTDPTVGWDGYFQNKQSQTGVYAYVVTYKNVYNEARIKKGNVTLIR